MTRRILVTRPAAQAGRLAGLLEQRGLETVMVPTVTVDAGSTAAELDAMLAELPGADWLIVTSANGAAALAARMAATGRGLPAGLRVAAVGPATARALQAAGIEVHQVPETYLTVAIADRLGDIVGRRIVLARADAATPQLRDALLARGASVEEVVAYRTTEGPAASRDLLHAALQQPIDGIAFTSGSGVRGLVRLASNVDRARARALPAFCIGPVTAAAARQAGFHVAAIAAEHTAIGLADAIATHRTTENR
jgi:uroporphyrinogen III methyltransferase/synthase